MQVNLKGWLFHSSHFCFCIPVRAGFVLIAILTFLLSGAISVIIWFEVFHAHQLTSKERAAFVLTGIVESLLFLASTIGFIGVVARKQLFVTIYTYFLCIHFVLNVIVGIYFLVTVRRQQLVNYCTEITVSDCSRLLSVSTYVFTAIVAVLLSFELYGVLIATRYVYRLRKQKRDDRSRRLGYFHALSEPNLGTRHTRQASDNIELLHSQDSTINPQDLEGVVLDIAPQSYMPVSTYDRDLPPPPVVSSPQSSSGTTPSRRIRALPPRPDTASVVTRVPAEERLPNPHETRQYSPRDRDGQMGSEDEHVYGGEVSSTAHSALMDHATYMRSIFARQNPPLR